VRVRVGSFCRLFSSSDFQSAADRSALFAGFAATMAESDFPRPWIIGYGSSPSRCGPVHFRRWSDAGYPRFRRDPCARDVAFDPGGTTTPVGRQATFRNEKTLRIRLLS
jgi:hypothetical protein